MLRQDLAAAKIEYRTDAGYFDFHAARHTGITRGSAIMRIDQLKSFARHAKVETTMRYIHTDADELREKVDLLAPVAPIEPAKRGGQRGAGIAARSGKKYDHECDHGSGSTSQGASSGRSGGHSSEKRHKPLRMQGLVID